jgi:hypothetical protein
MTLNASGFNTVEQNPEHKLGHLGIEILKQTTPIHGVHHYSNCAPTMPTKEVRQLPGQIVLQGKIPEKDSEINRSCITRSDALALA